MTATDSQHLTIEQLSSFIDGRLAFSERASAEGHLAACDRCKAELQDLQATVALVREMPEVDPPRDFRLPRTVTPLRPRRGSLALRLVPWTRAAGALAAALCVVLVSAEILSSFGGGTSPAKPGEVPKQTAAERPAASVQDRAAEAAKPAAPPQSPALAEPSSDKRGAPGPPAGAAARSAAPAEAPAAVPTAPGPTTAVAPHPTPVAAAEPPAITALTLRRWQLLSGALGVFLLTLSIALSRVARRTASA
jgi:anti-sigma factor RsiW